MQCGNVGLANEIPGLPPFDGVLGVGEKSVHLCMFLMGDGDDDDNTSSLNTTLR